MPRPDGRADDELRPITFERDYTEMAAGSVLVVAAANQRRAELESRGWSAVAAIPDAAGNTAAIVLQKP